MPTTLQAVEPHRHLSWTGKVIGTRAIHTWDLEPVGDAVIVTTAEALESWLVRLRQSDAEYPRHLAGGLIGEPEAACRTSR